MPFRVIGWKKSLTYDIKERVIYIATRYSFVILIFTKNINKAGINKSLKEYPSKTTLVIYELIIINLKLLSNCLPELTFNFCIRCLSTLKDIIIF